uniref:Neurotransmitter-gated ion-channel transmembrane domain-containing protein n=1 Tax=Plectus sambesii TaxID=2011161 RepID=A0A914VNL9_9BILA
MFALIVVSLIWIGWTVDYSEANPDAARLLETLFTGYNKLIRPVDHFRKVLTVKLKLKLSQLLDVVSLSISILISLTLFFLLLVEIIPSTSLVMPLIGLYLLFVMVVITLSIGVTVVTLNVRYRSPNTHQLPNWARTVFTKLLPWLLRMTRPSGYVYSKQQGGSHPSLPKPLVVPMECRVQLVSTVSGSNVPRTSWPRDEGDPLVKSITGPVEDAVDEALYIADFHRQLTVDNAIREDWRYIAQVLDRLFLVIFSLTCFLGTCYIILRAPVIYDTRPPLEYGRPKTNFETGQKRPALNAAIWSNVRSHFAHRLGPAVKRLRRWSQDETKTLAKQPADMDACRRRPSPGDPRGTLRSRRRSRWSPKTLLIIFVTSGLDPVARPIFRRPPLRGYLRSCWEVIVVTFFGR